jgi:CEP19-like protein
MWFRTIVDNVSDKDLEIAKQAMEVEFQKNKISKDAPEFKYDIKKEFGTVTGASDWDDDESLSASQAVAATKEKPEHQPATSITAEPVQTLLGQLPSLTPTLGNTMNGSRSMEAFTDDMYSLLSGLDKTIDQKVSEKKRSNPNLHLSFEEKISKVSPPGSKSSLAKSNSALVADQHKRSNPSLYDQKVKTVEHKKSFLSELPALKMDSNPSPMQPGILLVY